MRSLSIALILVTLYGCARSAEDDSNVRPPITELDLRIVRRAEQILSSEAVWNRADDRIFRPEATTFSLYTALEKATLEVGGKFTHREAAMQEARFTIGEIAPKRHYDHRLMDYNNDRETTFADIKRVLALTETNIAKKLELKK